MLLIGERIQEYRKARGLNQEEFAEKIGVSRQAVSKWERDKAYPDLDRVVCICEILDISIDELIYGQNATEKINTTVHLKNIRGTHSKARLKTISAIISVCCVFLMIVLSVLLIKNEWITHKENYEIARVEKVYSQYTKADVCYLGDDSRKIMDTIWLDETGIRDGDYIECYTGADRDRIYIKYKPATIIATAAVLIIFILLLLLTNLELMRMKKEDRMQIILEDSHENEIEQNKKRDV